MKLIFIRHGDPDYSIDSLTEKGWREATLLADRIAPMPITAYFVSPLGRARDTASLTLKKAGRTATEYEWLQEFSPKVQRPDLAEGDRRCGWDWLPADLAAHPNLLDREHWGEVPCFEEVGMKQEYDRVTAEFDRLLAKWGYERDGMLYHAARPNHDTLCFFCHFGIQCALISHLLNVSPMVLWQGVMTAPSAVTILHTEERREGTAVFRVSCLGDVSHLNAAGEPPAFAGRFCECYTDAENRHD